MQHPFAKSASSIPSLAGKAVAGFVLAWVAVGAAQAQAYVNVTVGGAFAPGVYGQVSIGNNPPPPVINVRPVVYGPPVYAAPVMYLHVAPEEYRDWGRYCGHYRACGHPVQFVRVDGGERWWERHNEHLLGREYYREEDRHERRAYHREEEQHERHERNERHGRQEHHDNGKHRGHRDDDRS